LRSLPPKLPTIGQAPRKAASAEVQVPVAHPPLELLLTCDRSVSLMATFVMSS
jgi:hypothetical protein